jgi:hypothetical protein
LVGATTVSLLSMIQLVFVFPTNREASDYLRLCIESGYMMEHDGFKPSSRLAKHLKEFAKTLGAKEIGRVDVRDFDNDDGICHMFSTMSVVGNVMTKIFVIKIVDSGTQLDWIELVAKALVYLEKQLVSTRSLTKSDEPLKEGFHESDLTICAFCGDGSKKLLACGRFHKARYCSAECQRTHYTMPGPFSHKHLCKAVAETVGK